MFMMFLLHPVELFLLEPHRHINLTKVKKQLKNSYLCFIIPALL